MENRLRQLRILRRLSQEELGKSVGVSRQTINAVENQRQEPAGPLVLRLAEVLGVPVEEVFFKPGPGRERKAHSQKDPEPPSFR